VGFVAVWAALAGFTIDSVWFGRAPRLEPSPSTR
jgi:hypothetical protein